VSRTIQPDQFIDLQMHTIYSDGHWQPEELLDYLATHHFQIVAITDHDQIDHIPTLQALGAKYGIAVIAATEMTTEWQGKMAHVLCYGFDPTDDELHRFLQATRDRQRRNTHQVYETLLRQGYTFPRQAEVLRATNGQLDRPTDNARLLREHGYASDWASAMRIITEAGFRTIMADLQAAIDTVHRAGGVALISHPGRREPGFTLYDIPLLEALSREVPLDGIEVYHPSHTQEQVREYRDYATARGWLQSAGSDSHGPRHRYPIPYAAHTVAALLERLGFTVADTAKHI
jgi:predicted metal-dependent phosphoesterase TrpH